MAPFTFGGATIGGNVYVAVRVVSRLCAAHVAAAVLASFHTHHTHPVAPAAVATSVINAFPLTERKGFDDGQSASGVADGAFFCSNIGGSVVFTPGYPDQAPCPTTLLSTPIDFQISTVAQAPVQVEGVMCAADEAFLQSRPAGACSNTRLARTRDAPTLTRSVACPRSRVASSRVHLHGALHLPDPGVPCPPAVRQRLPGWWVLAAAPTGSCLLLACAPTNAMTPRACDDQPVRNAMTSTGLTAMVARRRASSSSAATASGRAARRSAMTVTTTTTRPLAPRSAWYVRRRCPQGPQPGQRRARVRC